MAAPVALITGITGQTGSYLAEILAERGWVLHGLIREDDALARSGSPLPGAAQSVVADLNDTSVVKAIIADVGPDTIINLAALSSVALSWKEPLVTAEVNGLAVAAILDAAHALQERAGKRVTFVQASSAEIFGAAKHSPQNEQTAIAPVNPYGASKAYAHHLTGVYRALGVAASSCILYNHESPRRPESFVTRKITAGVARIEAGLQDKLVLGDLSVRRDWGWAPDYAAAIASIASGDNPDSYVVATGESHSIADFVSAAFETIGVSDWRSHVAIDQSLIRPADAPDLRGDSTRIRERFGWHPTMSFEAIVRSMVQNDRALIAASA